MKTLATVRIPEGDYRVQEDATVEKSLNGTTWVHIGPIIGTIGLAIITLQERSASYARLWRYSREDVTAAWEWMKDATDISVAPYPIITQIAQDIAQCTYEKEALARQVNHAV